MHFFPPPNTDFEYLCVFIVVLVVCAVRRTGTSVAVFLWAFVSVVLLSWTSGSIAGHSTRETSLLVPALQLTATIVAIGGHVRAVRAARKDKRQIAFPVGAGWSLAIFVVAFGILISPRMHGARYAAQRTQCKNNLKQLGVAMHQFHDSNDQFPAASSGSPPVSWRVKLLPFIYKTDLAKRYNVNAAWDAPSNTPIQKERYDVYACPTRPDQVDEDGRFMTSYLVPTGSGTIFENPDQTRIQDITDGTSSTIMMVEACGTRIVWTDPRDQNVDQTQNSINGPGPTSGESASVLSSYHSGGAQLLMADGSVRFVSEHIDSAVLSALLTKAGGETIGEW